MGGGGRSVCVGGTIWWGLLFGIFRIKKHQNRERPPDNQRELTLYVIFEWKTKSDPPFARWPHKRDAPEPCFDHFWTIIWSFLDHYIFFPHGLLEIRARAHALHVRTHGTFGRHIYANLHLESIDFMVIFLTKIIESRDPVCRRYFYITRTRNITIPAAQGDRKKIHQYL